MAAAWKLTVAGNHLHVCRAVACPTRAVAFRSRTYILTYLQVALRFCAVVTRCCDNVCYRSLSETWNFILKLRSLYPQGSKADSPECEAGMLPVHHDFGVRLRKWWFQLYLAWTGTDILFLKMLVDSVHEFILTFAFISNLHDWRKCVFIRFSLKVNGTEIMKLLVTTALWRGFCIPVNPFS
jgi:hypothetical protein